MENIPKTLSLSELISKSLPLSGASSLNPSSSSLHEHYQQHRQPLKPTSHQNHSFQTLPSLNYPTLIIGTLNLPTEANSSSNNSISCNCLLFSDDSSRVCCAVLDFDVKIIGKEIHVLSWNFIPFKCGGNGLLEIIRWKLPDSGYRLASCSSITTFPLSLNSSRDEVLEARTRVLCRLGSISPISVVPCTIQSSDSQVSSAQNSTPSRNVSGFLAEVLVCQCKLCRSKVSVTALLSCVHEGNNHVFNVSVTIYFFDSASNWHPMLSKFLGEVVCITGLKKKMIFIGKKESCLMFITTEKAALHMPQLPPKSLPFQRNKILGEGECSSYTGIVTGVYMQGMLVELDDKVWLLLTDRVLTTPHSSRVGALICVSNVHFVRPKFSCTRILLLGSCVKTSISLKSFSPLDSQSHIRFMSESMLGKFIESLVFSARFWLLLTISSFKKKFAGIFSEKEILGSKHKEGLVQMYAKSRLPSCVFRPRHGVFMEFSKHTSCGCGNEPNHSDPQLVVPISSFISHCEAMWVNFILRMQIDSETMKNNLYWCEGKSYHRNIKHIMSSEDLGLLLMGNLQISSSSGRLQMVDASGNIDVVIPDLPSQYNASNVYEVSHYSVVLEGLPEETDATLMNESNSFSCRNIFHHIPSRRGISLTSIYIHFYMRSTTCLNFCSRLPCIDWNDNIMGVKDGLFHLVLVTHKFPAMQKLHVNSVNKLNLFVEVIVLPWDLFLPGNDNDMCRRNSSEDQRRKRPKLTHGSTLTMASTLKGNSGDADYRLDRSFIDSNRFDGQSSYDHVFLDLDSSHKFPCFVSGKSFNNQSRARPGVLFCDNYNTMGGVVCKQNGQKLMLEFKSEYFRNYQSLQIGRYYVMKYEKENPQENAKDHFDISSDKAVVTSQTALCSVSFSCDEVLSHGEVLQQIVPTRTDMESCTNSSSGDLLVQRSPSQSHETCSGDINLHLSVAARNQLKLCMEVVENGLDNPIAISGETDSSFMFMVGATHSSGIADPDCRLPRGSLISLHGNIVDVHSFDCYPPDFKRQFTDKGIVDIQHKKFFQGLPSSICIHISANRQIVKLRGTLCKHAYPIGMGPGVSATFHRVLVVGQHDLLLTPVSFIVINSMKRFQKEQSHSFLSQFGSEILSDEEYILSSSFFSELIQKSGSNAMRFRCRVVAINVLVMETEGFESENSLSKGQSDAPVINIPCAGFILDDGSSPCCCWANGKRAAALLRLDEETMVNAVCGNSWRLDKNNLDKSRKAAKYHLQKILKRHNRITIKNYGSMLDSSCQDLTFSVNSNGVLGSSDESLLNLIIVNACSSSVFNVVGTLMHSNDIGRLEDLSGLDMAVHAMQNIWATEVQYANHRTEATNLIKELQMHS